MSLSSSLAVLSLLLFGSALLMAQHLATPRYYLVTLATASAFSAAASLYISFA